MRFSAFYGGGGFNRPQKPILRQTVFQSPPTQITRDRGADLCRGNRILPPQFSAPSQSLDWQCAARPTGGAFVATSGSFGVCVSTSIINQIPVALVYRM